MYKHLLRPSQRWIWTTSQHVMYLLSANFDGKLAYSNRSIIRAEEQETMLSFGALISEL